jgi:flagellar motor switch protein FliN/FliY
MTESAAMKDAVETVRKIELAELEESNVSGPSLLGENLDLIRNVKLRLAVSVGACELSVGELFALKENAVLSLDKNTREPVEVLLDGKVIARGTLVAVDDNFGVRISEIANR